jgi:hypothetical protein
MLTGGGALAGMSAAEAIGANLMTETVVINTARIRCMDHPQLFWV